MRGLGGEEDGQALTIEVAVRSFNLQNTVCHQSNDGVYTKITRQKILITKGERSADHMLDRVQASASPKAALVSTRSSLLTPHPTVFQKNDSNYDRRCNTL